MGSRGHRCNLSEAVSGRRWPTRRPGATYRERTPNLHSLCLGKNVKNYTGGHETPNKSFLITCLCYHKSAGLCYSPNCVINWFVSPNGPCNQGARVTTRPLLPNGLCHQTACVINRLVSPSGLCHQTVCVTKRPVSPNGACHQTRPSRAARKKNFKL